jgi:hypothetical protein
MLMPFGKYRGWELRDIPNSYLLWVLDTCDNIGPTLREAIRERVGLPPTRTGPDPRWQEVVQKWYWQLALDFHPDRGGSVEGMKAINEANERLRRMLGLSP